MEASVRPREEAARVAPPARQDEGVLTCDLRALKIAQHDVEAGDRLVDRQHERKVDPLALTPARVQRLLIEHDGFSVREGIGGFLRSLHEILQRLAGVFGPREVIREDLVVLGEPVGIQLLDGLGDRAVQLFASVQKERVIGNLMGQRVLEHIGQFGKECLLVDQLDGLQIPQELLRSLTEVSDPVEEAAGELAPDDRGELQRLLGRIRKPVDPRHDDVLNRVGNDDLVETLCEDVTIVRAPNGPDLLQRLDDLLDKKGIALRLPDDEGPQILRKAVRSQDGVRHVHAVFG